MENTSGNQIIQITPSGHSCRGMGYGYEHVKGTKESKITGIFDSSEPGRMGDGGQSRFDRDEVSY